ncbi:hypothetical protein HDU79_006116 [Rhizoclosmatium sp. JEL0117]|nr:hypothetical protein HDU79_006116 [Rhizoclosmatium sp. JEL0117]
MAENYKDKYIQAVEQLRAKLDNEVRLEKENREQYAQLQLLKHQNAQLQSEIKDLQRQNVLLKNKARIQPIGGQGSSQSEASVLIDTVAPPRDPPPAPPSKPTPSIKAATPSIAASTSTPSNPNDSPQIPRSKAQIVLPPNHVLSTFTSPSPSIRRVYRKPTARIMIPNIPIAPENEHQTQNQAPRSSQPQITLKSVIPSVHPDSRDSNPISNNGRPEMLSEIDFGTPVVTTMLHTPKQPSRIIISANERVSSATVLPPTPAPTPTPNPSPSKTRITSNLITHHHLTWYDLIRRVYPSFKTSFNNNATKAVKLKAAEFCLQYGLVEKGQFGFIQIPIHLCGAFMESVSGLMKDWQIGFEKAEGKRKRMEEENNMDTSTEDAALNKKQAVAEKDGPFKCTVDGCCQATKVFDSKKSFQNHGNYYHSLQCQVSAVPGLMEETVFYRSSMAGTFECRCTFQAHNVSTFREHFKYLRCSLLRTNTAPVNESAKTSQISTRIPAPAIEIQSDSTSSSSSQISIPEPKPAVEIQKASRIQPDSADENRLIGIKVSTVKNNISVIEEKDEMRAELIFKAPHIPQRIETQDPQPLEPRRLPAFQKRPMGHPKSLTSILKEQEGFDSDDDGPRSKSGSDSESESESDYLHLDDSEHDADSDVDNPNQTFCSVTGCQKPVIQTSQVKKHNQEFHSADGSVKFGNRGGELHRITRDTNGLLTCLCGMKYNSLFELREHARQCSGRYSSSARAILSLPDQLWFNIVRNRLDTPIGSKSFIPLLQGAMKFHQKHKLPREGNFLVPGPLVEEFVEHMRPVVDTLGSIDEGVDEEEVERGGYDYDSDSDGFDRMDEDGWSENDDRNHERDGENTMEELMNEDPPLVSCTRIILGIMPTYHLLEDNVKTGIQNAIREYLQDMGQPTLDEREMNGLCEHFIAEGPMVRQFADWISTELREVFPSLTV